MGANYSFKRTTGHLTPALAIRETLVTRHAIVILCALALPGPAIAQSAMETGAAILSERAALKARRGNLAGAVRDLNIAIEARPRVISYYKQRGLIYFSKRQYAKALADMDRYLSAVPGDSAIALVGDLAERSEKHEDIPLACAALVAVRAGLKDMGLEKYCYGQPGW